MAPSHAQGAYARRRPERTALYEVVRDNLETLYGAIDDGALDVRLGKHARKELEGYLDCGVLGRGFARLRCGDCKESRVVAFSCKGRGFCPSCTGRRMCDALRDPRRVDDRGEPDRARAAAGCATAVGADAPVSMAEEARAGRRAARSGVADLRVDGAGVLRRQDGGDDGSPPLRVPRSAAADVVGPTAQPALARGVPRRVVPRWDEFGRRPRLARARSPADARTPGSQPVRPRDLDRKGGSTEGFLGVPPTPASWR